LREDWTLEERKKKAGKRERKKEEENQQEKRKNSVKPSLNLVRFERYGS
jgi:hypothetical protein